MLTVKRITRPGLPEAGRIFGNLTLVGTHEVVGKHRYVDVKCTCGVEKSVRFDGILAGQVVSCGCVRNERNRVVNLRHGKGGKVAGRHPMYNTWSDMIQRCSNKKSAVYKYYGGRGITVCDEWLDFCNFDRDLASTWFIGASLERIDTMLGYAPANCRWATMEEQHENTRRSYLLTFEGKSYSTKALAIHLGISVDSLRRKLRIYHDYSLEAIVQSIQNHTYLHVTGTDSPNQFKRYKTC